MSEAKAREIKARIFETAVRLFARKSYGLVGVREIAKEAGVSISMISYHFGGKAGILQAIIQRYFELFNAMFRDAVRDDDTFDENVRRFIAGFVNLIRRQRDLSMVWFSELNNDIPEVHELKLHHSRAMATDANKLLGILGLDLNRDGEIINILGSAIIHMIYSHFISAPLLSDSPSPVILDDAYYDRYVDILTRLCLNGVGSAVADLD